MRGSVSAAVWAMLVLMLLILLIGNAWVIRHPPPHQEHNSGVRETP